MATDLSTMLTTFVHEEVLGGRDHPGPDDELLLSGMVDSMGVMVLLDHIEQTLDFAVPMEDVTIENFETIRAIAAYLDGALPKSEA